MSFYIGNMPANHVGGNNSSNKVGNYITDGRLDYWDNGTSQLADGYSATMWYSTLTMQNPPEGLPPFISRGTLEINEISIPTAVYYMNVIVHPDATVSVSQKIEQVRTLAGKDAMLSFWMSADVSTDIEITISQHYSDATGVKTNSVTQNVYVDTTFNQHYVLFSLPQLEALPINTGHITVSFKFFNSTAYKLTCVQLAEDSSDEFEELTPQDALLRLNRYYYTSALLGNYSYGAYNSGEVQTFVLPLPTVMRTVPVITASVSVTNGSGSISASSANSVLLTVNSSGITPPEPTVPPAPSPPFPSPTTVSATIANFVADARF
jgi:hypothetical protein